MSYFKESEHPRDEDGKFSGSGSGSSGSSTASQKKRAQITRTEKNALEWYAEQGFHEINSRLRDGEETSTSKAIDAAIGKSELGKPMSLYRGITREAFRNMMNGQQPKLGDVFEDKGFISTSTDYGVARSAGSGGVTLKINTHADQHGIDMNGISSNKDEKEIILPRGQKLKIVGYTKPNVGKGIYWPIIHVEAI